MKITKLIRSDFVVVAVEVSTITIGGEQHVLTPDLNWMQELQMRANFATQKDIEWLRTQGRVYVLDGHNHKPLTNGVYSDIPRFKKI